MRIRMTFEFSEEDRRAMAADMGHSKPLPRAAVIEWIGGKVAGALDEAHGQLAQDDED